MTGEYDKDPRVRALIGACEDLMRFEGHGADDPDEFYAACERAWPVMEAVPRALRRADRTVRTMVAFVRSSERVAAMDVMAGVNERLRAARGEPEDVKRRVMEAEVRYLARFRFRCDQEARRLHAVTEAQRVLGPDAALPVGLEGLLVVDGSVRERASRRLAR